ncbi:MAG: OmpW family protein [Rhodocyclaceae bacterium]|nr:MAG: OmpW family protein [Rhodocyclaceae bacterium]
MKKTQLALAVAALACASSAFAQQTEGNWMMRIRAVDIQPVKKWEDAGVLNRGSSDVYVQDKTIPEVDFTYFFTKNLAAELILTYPQKLNVKSETLGDLGSFDALPPTLTLQYHFMPESNFRPYVGAGINYTLISNSKVNKVAPLTLENDSWGAAFQIGFDYKIGANSYINFDVKKVQIDSDVKLNGNKVGKVTLDPLLVGIGYGFKF